MVVWDIAQFIGGFFAGAAVIGLCGVILIATGFFDD